MNLTSTADEVVMFCILASMTIFDALLTLLSIFKKGVCIDQRKLLMQKTNKELRSLLVGVKNTSKMNKAQLVNLLLELT
ncbi:hypothetical protein [Prochlorococcus marinus]|uniref:hypothetical protein n=1 Tax=Prochlorococcus marinus TaxID=1219 RepID=UPI0022B3BB42|nr:hypothetical protein [Prochlorococcus marinus]